MNNDLDSDWILHNNASIFSPRSFTEDKAFLCEVFLTTKNRIVLRTIKNKNAEFIAHAPGPRVGLVM